LFLFLAGHKINFNLRINQDRWGVLMKKFLRLWGASLVLALLSSGLVFAQEPVADKTAELEARVATVEDYVRKLSPQLTDFTKGLYADIDQRMKFMTDKTVVLNLVSKQFSKVTTNAGDFLIAVDRRERLDNAYRVVLKIGNPNNASYGDAKLRLFWGQSWDPSFVKPTYEEWRKSLRGAEYTFAGALEPGVWTEVIIDINAPQGEAFEYLECEMDVGTVKLLTK